MKLTDKEIICLAVAIKDVRRVVRQENFCDFGKLLCGKCMGCIRYKNMKDAFEIADKVLRNL